MDKFCLYTKYFAVSSGLIGSICGGYHGCMNTRHTNVIINSTNTIYTTYLYGITGVAIGLNWFIVAPVVIYRIYKH